MTSECHGESSIRSHLLQLDHWTFLLALVLVAANVVVNRRVVSGVAALLLLVALAYDVYEFYADS
jgi:hypothetical protein